ncbi:hypothetical protein F0U62_33560 [Cystobacter fuscus]|uniref:phospholipase D-like domain-containing protein n=1 Tax=Cystobacter fuscus TaxID=43 RepID=UPI002B28F8F8|nr:hypothetical protein F0U62_33560 [Cystobacter fuscus]
MRARYLDSRDVETLSEAMLKAASRSREMDIAAAFLTRAGAEQVLQLTRRLKGPQKKHQVRVLVGTWLNVTEPAALRQLRRVKGVCVRIAKPNGFHVKHVSFRGATDAVAFTGSANFTAKGLGGKGELVVEITDKIHSSTASAERDAFRRLWVDAYPDDLTAKVINAYAREWKSPRLFIKKGVLPGQRLQARFGKQAAKNSAPKDDGSVLWLPVRGTISDETEDALNAEAAGEKSCNFIGLNRKEAFTRIQNGTRHVWLLDLRGQPADRNLVFHRIIREVEMLTEDDGRYFAILAPASRSISLKKRSNREALKKLGLVHRLDSLASKRRTLKPGAQGIAAKLVEMSTPIKRAP